MDQGKRNIVILISQLVFGGAEKQSLLLAKELARDYNLRYVVMKPFKIAAEYELFLKEADIGYVILHGSFFLRIFRFFKLLRSWQADILFCYLPSDNLIGTFVGKLAGVRYIIGGIRNTKIVKRKFYLLRLVQNRFQDYVIFNSSRARELFCSRGYKPEKTIVIENAFPDQISFEPRSESKPVKILLVGRFVKQKDFLTGLKAVASLPGPIENKEIKLVVVGYGTLEKQVRDWVTDYGLDGITEFHIMPGNLPELFLKCDIYLNSSIHEGFSNAVMEAMAYGLPVVATNTGDIEKLVNHGRTGFIASVGDHKGLGEGLAVLCSDYQTRLSFGREGNKRIHEEFGIESFSEKYITLIKLLH